MNFARIFVRTGNSYEFACRDSTEDLTNKIENTITRKSTKPTLLEVAAATPVLVAEGAGASPASLPPASLPHSTQLSQPPASFAVSGHILSVRKKDKKENANAVARFKVEAKSNFFRTLLQPKLIGVITDAQSSRKVILKAQLPFLASRLINWSGNIALLSVFGMLGSFLLIPNPLPVIGVLLKTTLFPLAFAWILSRVCQHFVNSDLDKIANQLAALADGAKLQYIKAMPGEAIRKAFFSPNTLISLFAMVAILGGAAYLHNWAWKQWCQGQYQVSENLCEHVLHLAEFTLGKDSAGVAGCNYYIAECSRCEGKYDQARHYYNVALESLERTVDPSNTFIADHHRNLGRVDESQGNYKAALVQYKQALRIYEASPIFGPDCIWVASLLNRIAAAELKDNELVDAKKDADRACKIDRTYKWEAGRSIGEDLNDIGVIYARQGNWKQAQKTLLESLAVKKELPGLAGYSKAVALNNLSVVEGKLGNKDLAQKMQQESLALWRKFLNAPKDKRDGVGLYKEVLNRTKPEYEVPNYDGRSELLISGEGRI